MLHLDSNQFTGTIPSSLANLPLCKSTQSLVLIQVCPYSAHARRPPNFQRHSVLSDSNLTGTLDVFCGIDFDFFAANTCSAQVELHCAWCEPNFVCKELLSTQRILSWYASSVNISMAACLYPSHATRSEHADDPSMLHFLGEYLESN